MALDLAHHMQAVVNHHLHLETALELRNICIGHSVYDYYFNVPCTSTASPHYRPSRLRDIDDSTHTSITAMLFSPPSQPSIT